MGEVHDLVRGRATPAAVEAPLPISIEAEQAVLGTLLMHNDTLGEISTHVTPDDFSEDLHQRVFKVASDLLAKGSPANPGTIKAYIGDQDLGQGITISVYLAKLCAAAMPHSMASGFAIIVRSMSHRRKIIAAAQEVEAKARYADVQDEAATIAADGILALQGIAEASGTDTTAPIADYAETLMDLADGVRDGSVVHEAVTTGFKDLDAATSGYEPGTFWLTAGRPGMGKAQPLSSRIKTVSGWSTFAEVQVGDVIASVGLSENRVVGIYPQGIKDVLKVSLSDGRSARCCADHLWEVSYRGWDQPRVYSAAKLKEMLERVRYKGRLSIRQCAGHFGHSDDLPIAPWAVGALIGNGCLLNGLASFTSNDANTVSRLQSAVWVFGVVLNQVSKYTYNLSCPNKKGGSKNPLTEELKRLGLWGSHSYEKRIPSTYMLADRRARLALLQGLMDTDGWVEKQGSAMYATASQGLAADVADLARSLGYWAKTSEREAFVYSKTAPPDQKLNSFKVCITGPGIEEICLLQRKRDRLAKRSWSRALTIDSIISDGSEECACISVSHPSCLYITDDYVVTHNTIVVNSSAARVAKTGVGVLIFPLEIGAEQMTARFLADLCFRSRNPVAFRDIGRRSRELSDTDMVAVRNAQRHLAGLPIEMDSRSRVTVGQIGAKVAQTRAAMAARGIRLGVVFIDHLDFIHASDRYGGNRTQEIGEICIHLKAIARNNHVCINLLSQLSREVEKRSANDRRPGLSDLRNSGDLEQVADVAMFLYREEYYLTRSPEYLAGDADAIDAAIRAKGKLEAILGKVRAGPTPTIHLFCEPASSSISSFERAR